MILGCPNCSTRFQIASGSLGPQGRKVRCGNCGYVWHQEPVPDAPPPDDPIAASAAPAAAEPEPDLPELGDEERRLWPVVSAWAVFVVMLGAIVVGGYQFRNTFTQLYPPLAVIYEGIGVPIDSLSLRLDADRIRNEKVGERPVVVVEGTVSNLSVGLKDIPLIRLELMGQDGEVLQVWDFSPATRKLDGGETIRWQTEIENPHSAAFKVKASWVPAP